MLFFVTDIHYTYYTLYTQPSTKNIIQGYSRFINSYFLNITSKTADLNLLTPHYSLLKALKVRQNFDPHWGPPPTPVPSFSTFCVGWATFNWGESITEGWFSEINLSETHTHGWGAGGERLNAGEVEILVLISIEGIQSAPWWRPCPVLEAQTQPFIYQQTFCYFFCSSKDRKISRLKSPPPKWQLSHVRKNKLWRSVRRMRLW